MWSLQHKGHKIRWALLSTQIIKAVHIKPHSFVQTVELQHLRIQLHELQYNRLKDRQTVKRVANNKRNYDDSRPRARNYILQMQRCWQSLGCGDTISIILITTTVWVKPQNIYLYKIEYLFSYLKITWLSCMFLRFLICFLIFDPVGW